MPQAQARIAPTSSWWSLERVQAAMVAMIFVTSFVSLFEPAPTDYFFVLATLISLVAGLRLSPVLAPLLFLLLVYNLSGVASYLMIKHDIYEGHMFLIGLALTSASAILISAYVAADPVPRFLLIRNAWWVGATIGAIIGLASTFRVEPIATLLPDFAGRVVGAYKDPNVYSTWLVPPIVFMVQGFVLGTLRPKPLTLVSFLLMVAALFLAFSRGAWINGLLAIMMTVTFCFVLAPSPKVRERTIIVALIGIILLTVLLAILLSIPQTRELFLDRFTLVKHYDAGETGRFGNQINSIPMLIERPMGFGPYQFVAYFNLAPHNTFLNSFASCGWVGGIAYIVLTVTSIVAGFRSIIARTPFQPYAIAAFSCLLAVMFQGVQIDTEHWRHYYWVIGLTWGFFAASFAYERKGARFADIAQVWHLKLPSAGYSR